MGKLLQKKKERSGRSKARAKDSRLKSGHKKINVLGNQIIADNWYATSCSAAERTNQLTSTGIVT
jgi:hypothetical protein